MIPIIFPKKIQSPTGEDFVTLLKHIKEIKDILATTEALANMPVFKDGDFDQYLQRFISPLVNKINQFESEINKCKEQMKNAVNAQEEMRTALITNTTNDSKINNDVKEMQNFIEKFTRDSENCIQNLHTAVKTISEKTPIITHEVRYANATDTVILDDSIFSLPAENIKHIVGSGKILISSGNNQPVSVVFLHGSFEIHGRKVTDGFLINDGTGYKYKKKGE